MLKREKIALSVVAVIAVSLFVVKVTEWVTPKPKNVVYVDNVILFQEFKMSQDYKQEYEVKIKQQATQLDSLVVAYKELAEKNKRKKKDTPEEVSLKEEIQKEDTQLRNLQNYFTNQVTQQVWDRLNVYIKEYASKKSYKMVIGAQGNGNLMYSDQTLDITQDILEYANKQYEGL